MATVHERQLALEVSKDTGLSVGTVTAALNAATDRAVLHLAAGKRVRLGSIGELYKINGLGRDMSTGTAGAIVPYTQIRVRKRKLWAAVAAVRGLGAARG